MSYELSFCAPVANYPMADKALGGFDIDIAELLADELGAEASIVWTTFDEIGIRDTLHSGLCDVALGVTEGVEGLLTTVPYLKTSYAFVTLAADDIEIESLDDPQLRQLRIATYQAGLPSIALQRRGIVDNVIEIAAIIRPTGVDSNTPILDTLVSDVADVAIVYGPAAAARASLEAEALRITPVTPELDFGSNLLQLSRIITMGVRPNDEALRDNLNRAFAHRWEDVTAILDAYSIPRFPVSPPIDTAELAGAYKVGVIVPARTPAALTNSPIGDDGLRGALVAENAVSLGSASTVPFHVLLANAPTVAAVERAARRLIAVDGVHALIGGYDPMEAEAIARVAAQFDIPFFNVGSEEDALRDLACYPTAFHVAPSTSLMTESTLRVAASHGAVQIHAVLVRDGGEEALLQSLTDVAQTLGVEVVGHTFVDDGQYVYYPIINELAASSVDAVLLNMSAESQEVFLSQAATVAGLPPLLGVTPVRGQSRPYLHRFIQVAATVATEPRVVVWDPAFESPLNTTFSARTGEPMEAPAWTTYAAVVIASQAAAAGSLESTGSLREYLQDSGNLIDVGKESPVYFVSDDQQMRQELYVIEPRADASWGRTVAARTALAGIVDVVSDLDHVVRQQGPATCGSH
jgi:mxaJ protein